MWLGHVSNRAAGSPHRAVDPAADVEHGTAIKAGASFNSNEAGDGLQGMAP